MKNIKDIKSLLINEKNITALAKKENNFFNLKKLLGVDIDQSQSIRFGNLYQDWIKSLASNFGAEIIDIHFMDIYKTGNVKTNKGLKDIDILFRFNGKMYYFEAKTSLDLDSEKSKATYAKISDVTEYIKTEYPDDEVVSGVLSCWYEKEIGLPFKLKTDAFFIKDIFNILGIEASKEEYYELMREFGSNLK